MKHTLRTRLLLTLPVLLIWTLIALAACAPRQNAVLPQGEKVTRGVWLFQHKLHLDIPGRGISQDFTGMMRLDLAAQSMRVAGVAGLGMQLFALRVTPDDITVDYMHPILRKIPHAQAHITACVRTIWFDYLPQIRLNTPVRLGDIVLEATGERVAGLWPEHVRYTDEKIPFTLRVRLLQAQQEEQ